MRRGLLLVVILGLFGCKEPLDKNFETVTGKYKIGYFRSSKPNENVLVYCSECSEMMAVVIPKKVRRLGFNDRYIIIERKGNYDELYAPPLDSLIVRYYIIDMEKKPDVLDEEYYFGPVDSVEFQTRKLEIGIEGLEFTKEYKVD